MAVVAVIRQHILVLKRADPIMRRVSSAVLGYFGAHMAVGAGVSDARHGGGFPAVDGFELRMLHLDHRKRQGLQRCLRACVWYRNWWRYYY